MINVTKLTVVEDFGWEIIAYLLRTMLIRAVLLVLASESLSLRMKNFCVRRYSRKSPPSSELYKYVVPMVEPTIGEVLLFTIALSNAI